MNRLRWFVPVFCAALLFGLAASAQARSDEKEKPKDAAVLDDAAGTLTETVDGKPKEKKLELKYCLKVKGYFDKDGLNIEEVDGSGPATKLQNATGQDVMLEKGDIITEIDGKKIKSADDYVKALNGATDHSKVKVKIKDVRTGEEQSFEANTEMR
jgi:S1-C subfamily serine protease